MSALSSVGRATLSIPRGQRFNTHHGQINAQLTFSLQIHLIYLTRLMCRIGLMCLMCLVRLMCVIQS